MLVVFVVFVVLVRLVLLDVWKQYGAAGHLCVRGRNRTVFLQFTKEVWN